MVLAANDVASNTRRSSTDPGAISIAPRVDERAFGVGTTRHGKTTLFIELLARVRRTRVIAVNTKGSHALEAFCAAAGYFPSAYPVMPTATYPRVLLNVPAEWEPLEPLWRAVLAEGDLLVYVDELSHISSSRTSEGAALRQLYAAGGERGVGIWAGTQQPYHVATHALTESERFFVFRLKRLQDRTYMRGYIGDAALEAGRLGVGEFFYHDGDLEEAIRCEPIKRTARA